jgi:predicted nuclease of predicted toxin-antitoxin system
VKLLLDEHYTDDIASQLRAVGHDAVTVSERGLRGTDDESLLAFAVSEGRALATNNARDFLLLVGRLAASGDDHYGLLLTADASMPRAKNTIGRYIETLSALMTANPEARAVVNQVRWLS